MAERKTKSGFYPDTIGLLPDYLLVPTSIGRQNEWCVIGDLNIHGHCSRVALPLNFGGPSTSEPEFPSMYESVMRSITHHLGSLDAPRWRYYAYQLSGTRHLDAYLKSCAVHAAVSTTENE